MADFFVIFFIAGLIGSFFMALFMGANDISNVSDKSQRSTQ